MNTGTCRLVTATALGERWRRVLLIVSARRRRHRAADEMQTRKHRSEATQSSSGSSSKTERSQRPLGRWKGGRGSHKLKSQTRSGINGSTVTAHEQPFNKCPRKANHSTAPTAPLNSVRACSKRRLLVSVERGKNISHRVNKSTDQTSKLTWSRFDDVQMNVNKFSLIRFSQRASAECPTRLQRSRSSHNKSRRDRSCDVTGPETSALQ